MGVHVERAREWSTVEPVVDGARPRRSVAALPRRRRRRLEAWRVAAVLAAIGVAFTAGRVAVPAARASAREPAASPRTTRAWNDTGSLVAQVARVKLVERVGDRLVDVFPEGSRVVALYDVGDLLEQLPSYPEPEISLPLMRPGGGGRGTLTFEPEQEQDGASKIDPEELIEIVEGKLGEDDDHRVDCTGGVLVVAGALRTQEKVARLVAALDEAARE